MRSSLRVAAAAAALLATLVLAPTAGAAVKVQAALQRSADALVLEVKVTSTRAFSASSRPRSVRVGTFSLRRSASSRKAVTFRTSPQRGAAATKLEQLANTRAAIKVTTAGGTKTMRTSVKPAPAPAGTAPGGGGTTPPGTPPSTGTVPAASLTRNDAAGQSAMSGDLLLQWESWGNVSAEYRRIWLLADGTFRLNIIDYMHEMGEKCRQWITGTWTFKEGYTTDYNGGGVVVKIGITSSAGSGDEVLAFGNAAPNSVFVGPEGVRYERNSQIMQNCP